jgi:hypothetical protein
MVKERAPPDGPKNGFMTGVAGVSGRDGVDGRGEAGFDEDGVE